MKLAVNNPMKVLFFTCLISLFLSCQQKQYGVGTLNYDNRIQQENREKIAAHGDKSRESTASENDRIKFYNNPEYRQKKLRKKLKKRQKKQEEKAGTN